MSFQLTEPLSSLDVEIRDAYTGVLQQIRIRLNDSYAAIDGIPSGEPIVDVLCCERAALQIRKVLELIVLSSLVTNRESLEAVSVAFRDHDAAKARKLVRKFNPYYWPTPVWQFPIAEGVWMPIPVKDGFLTEGDWRRAFGMTSKLVHAVSPFRKLPNPATSKDALKELLASILVLLKEHYVALVGGTKWVTGRLDDGTGKAQAGIAQPLRQAKEQPQAIRQLESPDSAITE